MPGALAFSSPRTALRSRSEPMSELDRLLTEIRACRRCIESPIGRALPHAPRPVVRAAATARLAIVGQAPGTRVHESGMPFLDRSGDRLREWMGLSGDQFYDERHVAIVPMGFCFPGLDKHGSDLPPRRECAPAWRQRVMSLLPDLELVLVVGSYAQQWHLSRVNEKPHRSNMTDTVAGWREIAARPGRPRLFPLPHPSWRNNVWLRRNPWFEAQLLPDLRAEVARALD